MMRRSLKSAVAAVTGIMAVASAAQAAVDPKNPDWPCVQKKVENLSVMAIWDGPSLEEHKDWFRADKVPALVTKLASRRVPMEKATKAIDDFAAAAPEADRDALLTKVFAGLFDTVNTQRRSIIGGIEKYQRSQKARAAELEQQGVNLAQLKGDIVVDDTAAVPESEEEQKLYWAGRIFQERQANIPIACELPAVLEERLFELTRHIRSKMSK
ncbi:MAG: hypothetical protein MUE84_14665 [Hyphomonas sp.]|nr:hypothetical protein [Hyphomonas sp.]